MADGRQAVRVLLLARAGEARGRLETALADAGAELLRAVDPADGDPDADRALRPGAVLVALEPAIEDALERYDALLSDPDVLVMFDEAEVAARRSGWDAARWVRHLAAKLNGHADVLPPGADPEEAVLPEPGPLPAAGFDPDRVDVGAMAAAAHELSAEVPRALDFDVQAPGEDAGEADALDGTVVGAQDDDATPAATTGFSGLVAAEDMDWSSAAADPLPLDDDAGLAELLANSGARLEAASGDAAEGADDGETGLSLAFDAPFDAGFESGFDAADTETDTGQEASTADAAPDPLSLGDGLSLADDDAPLETRDTSADIDLGSLEARLEGLSLAGEDDGPIAGPSPGAPGLDLDALSGRLGGLSLADPESYGHGPVRGAVVVEAGIGGPDAVRQLLGGLGTGFARAVLVRLQLDGGRYDRLVEQMQRASALPVRLAASGQPVDTAVVHFLPPGVTVVAERGQLRFADAGAETATGYDALPATDTAVVFLSGADAGRVGRALEMAGAGALVLAQAPESCYDAAAVTALVAGGAVSAEPGDLAQALIDRWH